MTGKEFVEQQGWQHKEAGIEQLVLDTCPLCGVEGDKFYINAESGLWDCKVCGKAGNIYKLKELLGITTAANSFSVKDAVNAKAGAQPLPDLMSMHKRIFDENMADVLDYLVYERRISTEVIERFKLGADYSHDSKWVIIPYLNKEGTPVYYKGRSLPKEGEKKKYRAPAGREACLFNEASIKEDLDELVMVEGELDALTLVSNGYENVVGIPGANNKKTTWVDLLDKYQPKKIYLCYDNDKVGQEGAKEMATKIGLHRVYNILLPQFTTKNNKAGKDVNEYFCSGKTLEDFKELMAQAKPFDVQGVQNVVEVLAELKEEIENKGTDPKYDTPWPTLTKKVGGFEDGDLIGIMAEGKVGKTTMALNMCQYYASKGHPSFMFCQEMPPRRMVRKWVSHVTQTDDTPGASLITTAKVDEALEVAKQMQGDILFGFHSSSRASDIFDTIRQTVRRYGVKVVCFDNLQMMVNSLEHSQQETSKITKQFKKLAMELGIVILLIIQPHRTKDGQIISARNAHGSSAIEKDVDTMLCLHRNRVVGTMKEEDFQGIMETDETFEPHLFVKVDLTRYSPGGTCTLFMNGATSSVTEITAQETKTISNPFTEADALPI